MSHIYNLINEKDFFSNSEKQNMFTFTLIRSEKEEKIISLLKDKKFDFIVNFEFIISFLVENKKYEVIYFILDNYPEKINTEKDLLLSISDDNSFFNERLVNLLLSKKYFTDNINFSYLFTRVHDKFKDKLNLLIKTVPYWKTDDPLFLINVFYCIAKSKNIEFFQALYNKVKSSEVFITVENKFSDDVTGKVFFELKEQALLANNIRNF